MPDVRLTHPGYYDEHAAGHVDGEQVVGELPLEDHEHLDGGGTL